MDKIIKNDMEQLSSASYIEWDKLSGADFLITGSTGLIGSMAARALAYARKKSGSDSKIYILARSLDKVRRIFGEKYAEDGLVPVIGDIRDAELPDCNVDYIIHGASVTTSKYMVTNPVETFMTAVAGTEAMLRFAKEKCVKGMVYLSSMEMYGYTTPEQNPITEDKLGFVDILKVRSCYPEGKRACECLCASYANEYHVPVSIARLAQVFGTGVSVEDNRVFASFAKSAMKHEDLVLHTLGNSVGNYCYTADAIGALLCLLTKGEPGEAYNVVNENNTMKIREMAELVAKEISGGVSEVKFDIPEDSLKYGYAPDTNMRLSSEKIRKLGWNSHIDLPEMYRRMIAGWENQIGENHNAEH